MNAPLSYHRTGARSRHPLHVKFNSVRDIPLLKLAEVKELTRLSRSTIYKWKALGQFPQPVKIGPHAVRWYLDDVLHYINTRPRSR